MYKGDYFPRLVHNKRRDSWELEPILSDDDRRAAESTVYHRGVDGDLLKDTVIYCAAERYGLDELKKLSLRKQGLRKLLMTCSSLAFFLTQNQNRVFSAALSLPRQDMHMPIPPTMTQSYERITWL
jgi:hypothetical protein